MSEINDVKVTEKVGALFAEHGVGLVPSDYWLAHQSGFAVSADVTPGESSNSRLSVKLDIDLSMPDGRLLTESFMGVGSTIDDAIDDAVDNFEENSLHVFLTAFFGRPPSPVATVEKWVVDGVSWRVIAGNFGCRQSEKGLIQELPEQLFTEIENAIRGSHLHLNTHWFRIFYTQMDKKSLSIELLMDNEPWETAKAPLSRVPWKKTKGYYSVRSFVVVTRETPINVSLLDEKKAIAQGLDIVLDAWGKNGCTEADIYRRLTNASISPDVAERLLTFTPLGFSNVFLQGADLPETYQLMVDGESGEDRRLEEEPVFVEARKRAVDTSAELLRKHASHCAMVEAVSQAVDDLDELTSERLGEFEFATPTIYMPRFRPESPRRVSWWKKVVGKVANR